MLTDSQLVKKFPAFYGTHRFITTFTRPCTWSLSWARRIQSTPSYPICLRATLNISYLYLSLPSGLFLSGFPVQILYAFLISPMHTSCSAHLMLCCRPHTPSLWVYHMVWEMKHTNGETNIIFRLWLDLIHQMKGCRKMTVIINRKNKWYNTHANSISRLMKWMTKILQT
jgi:hypothetical protein